jgi:hypothetical protein
VGEFIVTPVEIPTADLIYYPMPWGTELILVVDRNSFDALKELLREKSAYTRTPEATASLEAPSDRAQREALKRLFDQIRDVNYNAA